MGPELCQVVLDVFANAGVPIDFEEHYLTELYARKSESLEDVVDSIRRNKLCLKGILATPDHSSDGELKTLNMKLRWELSKLLLCYVKMSVTTVLCRSNF